MPHSKLTGETIPRFAHLRLSDQESQPHEALPVHEAWVALRAELLAAEASGIFLGILVLPANEERTNVAAHFLLSDVLARSEKVLWLVHRSEQIAHVVSAFHQLAPLASPKETLSIRAVSSEHCSTSQIAMSDDIIVASIDSLARRSLNAEKILAGRFIVIDEAEFAFERTYRSVVNRLNEHRRHRLLGLMASAGPNHEAQLDLVKEMFDGKILYEQK